MSDASLGACGKCRNRTTLNAHNLCESCMTWKCPCIHCRPERDLYIALWVSEYGGPPANAEEQAAFSFGRLAYEAGLHDGGSQRRR